MYINTPFAKNLAKNLLYFFKYFYILACLIYLHSVLMSLCFCFQNINYVFMMLLSMTAPGNFTQYIVSFCSFSI